MKANRRFLGLKRCYPTYDIYEIGNLDRDLDEQHRHRTSEEDSRITLGERKRLMSYEGIHPGCMRDF